LNQRVALAYVLAPPQKNSRARCWFATTPSTTSLSSTAPTMRSVSPGEPASA
jgi:hypothetical protein